MSFAHNFSTRKASTTVPLKKLDKWTICRLYNTLVTTQASNGTKDGKKGVPEKARRKAANGF